MAIKVVMVFQEITLLDVNGGVNPVNAPSIGYVGKPHIGGWTESLIWGTDDVSSLIKALTLGTQTQFFNPPLLDSRAALLPSACSLVGVKLYQGGAGKGRSLALARPGNPQYNTDIPQMALLMKSGGLNTTAVRRWTVRAIPDLMVVNGEFAPTPTYTILMQNYQTSLRQFGFFGIDPVASKKVAIFKIDAAGNVTTKNGANPFAVPSIVRISRAISNTDGTFLSKTDTIGLPDAGSGAQFKIANWTFGSATGGNAVQNVSGFFAFDYNTMAAARIVTRRVGRPFEQYHGRRSKRRKIA
jgi:hypothetical protein